MRGRASNRRIEEEVEQRAILELSRPECRDLGPTFAAEQLNRQVNIHVGKDTVRKGMREAGLWRARERSVQAVHRWRPAVLCGRVGAVDTSVHEWLAGRGERLYLVAMIDDAISRVFARFVRHDSRKRICACCGAIWSTMADHWPSVRTKPGCAKSHPNAPAAEMAKRGRRRRSPVRRRNWASSGSRPTVPRPKLTLHTALANPSPAADHSAA